MLITIISILFIIILLATCYCIVKILGVINCCEVSNLKQVWKILILIMLVQAIAYLVLLNMVQYSYLPALQAIGKL